MEAYIDNLKNDETFFVLFNENNFHDYLITDGMLFNFDDFNIVLHFFEDFYNFNLNIAQKENEYVISLGEKIAKKIGYEFCGFYPKSNCNYTNIETEIKIKNLQKEIINGIIQDQVNYYIPNENNNRVICFHNGNGESGDSMRGDRQLEKYIERDGNAVKGVELLSEIAEMDSIVTVRRWQNTTRRSSKST